ncbi:Protein of unknown function [Gryllus bimaculatus]|nr:Protein of unknown function [Gryllus bimaculatus]
MYANVCHLVRAFACACVCIPPSTHFPESRALRRGVRTGSSATTRRRCCAWTARRGVGGDPRRPLGLRAGARRRRPSQEPAALHHRQPHRPRQRQRLPRRLGEYLGYVPRLAYRTVVPKVAVSNLIEAVDF